MVKQCTNYLPGADNNKDQSYFLCQLSQNNYLNHFPIGECKPEVREIAAQMELVTAEFSRFVFIGKVRLPEFCNKITAKKRIIQIDKTIIYTVEEQEDYQILSFARKK
jgi:tRNA-specific 2-thiouridylase